MEIIINNQDKDTIRLKYDRYSKKYNLFKGHLELLGVRKLRKELLKNASGKILEIAVGTGKNLKFYPRYSDITAIDISIGMLDIARKKAKKTTHNIVFEIMDAEHLLFKDKEFDTVVISLALSTFTNPVASLKEIARVCKSNGKILILENGRSNHGLLARFQDRMAEHHAKILGSYWNRDPVDIAKNAGLRDIDSKSVFFGIFHAISARP